MNIPALSMGLAQTKTLSEVGTAMLAKSLDGRHDEVFHGIIC